MMRSVHDLPIRRKLVLVMSLTSLVAVLLVGACWLSYELLGFRRAIVRDLATQAEIIGANCAAALAFQDQGAAQDVLAGLRARPEIVCALVFGPDGTVFASYPPQGACRDPQARADGVEFAGYNLLVRRSIRLGDDVVGSIYLDADLSVSYAHLAVYGLLAVVALVVVWFIAVLVAARLQQVVSEPILALAHAAKTVRAQHDYGLRVLKRGRDEIGVLTDDFNAMLAQIEQSDEAVRASEQRFRQLAETIGEVFWLSNPAKTEMLYVSPAYEEIWGRSCASLYAAPQTWAEAIHPDDLARIWQAAMSKQVAGTYDEEYRIVRPDGSIRWIRDRAFPIRDGSGQVYRLAGLAEDVTVRKRLEQEILEVSEREQRRIGQDLHDSLCQHLLGTSLAVKALENALAARGLPQASQAAAIGDLLHQALDQARTLARGLSPVQFDAHGLTTALRELAGSMEARSGIACPFVCAEPVPVEDPFVATHLYRIAQEAVTNAVRHSHAARITIALEAVDDAGWLTVTDNGVGIAERAGERGGLGLHTMAYRAGMIGGTIEVRREPQGGTRVCCSFRLRPSGNRPAVPPVLAKAGGVC